MIVYGANSENGGEDGKEQETYLGIVSFKDFWIPDLPIKVINPKSQLFVHWQSFIILLVLFSSFASPFRFGFLIDAARYDTYLALDVFENIVDCFFLVDIVLTFRLAYIEYGKMVTELDSIAMNYMRRTFVIDVLATIPFDLMGAKGTGALSLLRLMRMNRVLKLFRRLEQDYNYNYYFLCIFKLTLLLVEAAHLAACCFHHLGMKSPEGESWLSTVSQVDLPNESLSIKYVYSVYWGITTISTVGYGDISPQTMGEKIFGSICMLFNMSVTAYVLGTMTIIATKSDEAVSTYRHQMAALDDLLKRKNVPEDLKNSALQQLHLSFDRRADRDGALQFCPTFMKNHIMKFLYDSQVKSVFLFKGCSQHFIDKLVTATQVEFFQPGTRMMTEGENFDSIVYIVEGTVGVFHEGKQVGDFIKGNTFGQIPVICHVTSSLTAISRTFCHLFFFSNVAYNELAELYPEEAKKCRHNVLDWITEMSTTEDEHGNKKKIQPFANIALEVRESVEKMDLAMESEANPMLAGDRTQTRFVLEAKEDEQHEIHARMCSLAARGETTRLRAMLDNNLASPRLKDQDHRTLLHHASAHGQFSVVQLLLEDKRVDVNAVDKYGITPLAAAVYKANWPSVGESLRSHGAELRLPNPGSALCDAAWSWDSALVRRLCESGVDVNAANFDGRRALHLAAAEGALLVVQVLIEFKADVKVKDRWGRTPMDEAKQAGHKEVANFLLKFSFDEPAISLDEPAISVDEPAISFDERSVVATAPVEIYMDCDNIPIL